MKKKKGLVNEIEIIEKPNYITWEEITELLHAAFKERRVQGLNYLATHQSVEITKKRAAGATCLVALYKGKLVGTVTVQFNHSIDEKKRKWYHESSYAYSKQLAVLPEYKGFGIGKALQDARLELCYNNEMDALIFDTSCKAKSLIARFLWLGAQKVDFISHSATNYYSIVFRIQIKGKKFNSYYCSFRYHLSKVKCIILKNKYGDYRLIGKIVKKIKASNYE